MGILVGRGFLPGTVTVISDLKTQINRLQEMVRLNKPSVSPKKQPAPDPELAFYEKLSSRKEETKKKSIPESISKAPQKETTQKEVEATLEKVPEKEKNENPEIMDIQNELLTPEARFTVQLASLGDRGKAEKMVSQLIDRGYPAYVYEAEVKGKTYYRVRCGRFMGRDEAKDYSRKLAEEAGLAGFVSRLE